MLPRRPKTWSQVGAGPAHDVGGTHGAGLARHLPALFAGVAGLRVDRRELERAARSDAPTKHDCH